MNFHVVLLLLPLHYISEANIVLVPTLFRWRFTLKTCNQIVKYDTLWFPVILGLYHLVFDIKFDFWAVRKWTQVWFVAARLAAGEPHHHFCWLLLQSLPNGGEMHKLWFQWTRRSFFFVDWRNVSASSQTSTQNIDFLTTQNISRRFLLSSVLPLKLKDHFNNYIFLMWDQ